jgi:hypothetical protein
MKLEQLTRGMRAALIMIAGLGVIFTSAGCEVRCDPTALQSTCPDSAPFCVASEDGSGVCSTDEPDDDDAGQTGDDAGSDDDAGIDDDAGALDAGTLDAGALDAGNVDAGTDSGPADAGYDAGPGCLQGAPCGGDAGACPGPCSGDPTCFDATCVADGGGCAYTVAPSRVCVQAGCTDGLVSVEVSCGADGACAPPDGGQTSCDGYQCQNAASCRVDCASNADCVDGYFCSDSDNSCLPLLDDGEDCTAVGSNGCGSGYCDGTLCCAGGDCCNLPSECPSIYSAVPACGDATGTTDCQGTRTDATCDNNVCGSSPEFDDSACAGAALACSNNLASIACSAEVDQPEPMCPAICTGDEHCLMGFQCVSETCTEIAGLGADCSGGQVCEMGLKCDNDLCCGESGSACCDASNEATACGGGLECIIASNSCETACVVGTSQGCASTDDYCVDGSVCASKKMTSSACDVGGECVTGNCVDNFCCDGPCGGTCRGCSDALTGLGNGACGDIVDDVETGVCDGNGGSAGSGASCQCADGACGLTLGLVFSIDGDCASGNCECADASCSTKRCNEVACSTCEFADSNYADASCTGDQSGTTCSGCSGGSCECNAGVCELADGQACTSDGECASSNCECSNASCSSKKCNNTTCATCKYDGSNYTDGSCTTNGTMSCSGCGVGGCICSGGNCDRETGQICTADSQCATNNCECSNNTCSQKRCSVVSCAACKYNSDGLNTCEGNIVKGDQGSCGSGQVCTTAGGSCSAPGSCSCSCADLCDTGTPMINLCTSVVQAGGCNSGFAPSESCGCSSGNGCTNGGATCNASVTGSCTCVLQ